MGNTTEQRGGIMESMQQAFGRGSFYGLEYVLDELDCGQAPPAKHGAVDWFGFWDRFD